jgi:putative phage-type endonuclease
MAQLVAERLTQTPSESFSTPAMQWGVDHEPEARAAYQFFTDNKVQTAGFIAHPRIAMSGASPDGLVGDDGLVELKCPNTATHIETLLEGGIPRRYKSQMLWQLACTGRDWCDLVSYDPRLPQGMSLFVQRLHRNDEEIIALELEVVTFLGELNQLCERLTKQFELEEIA